MPTKGDWGKVLINGTSLYQKTTQANFKHGQTKIQTQPDNVGIQQAAPGVFDPSANIGGYRAVQNPYASDPHNILGLAGSGVGAAYDPEYITTILYGNNAAPAAGDIAAMLSATLLNYDTGQVNPTDVFKFMAQLGPRGKRPAVGHLLIDQPATLTGTITSAFLDRGAAGAGTTKGMVAHLHCITPAGAQATDTLTVNVNPADGDTFTISDGVTTIVARAKTTPAQANDFLIGGTTSATALNIYRMLIGSQNTLGTSYFAGSAKLPATMTVAKPASNVLTFTAVLYGTAGNAYTLARTGTGLVVGGANFTGGTAGDSYVVTLQHCATSGGAYTVFATFVSTLQQPGGERLEILPSALTSINQFIKIVATTGGSTSKPSFVGAFSANWQN